MSKKKQHNKAADIRLLSYDITEEPLEDKHTQKIPSEIRDRNEELHDMINRQPKKVIPQLIAYKEKYPNVPLLYNYLCAAYARIGDFEKVESISLENLEKNTDYLFAKLNYADVCLQKGEYAKIPKILDHKLDLKLLYPNRASFHISEYIGFTGIMCKYYNATGERKLAEKLFKTLKEIAPRHATTKEVKRVLYPSFIFSLFKLIVWPLISIFKPKKLNND